MRAEPEYEPGTLPRVWVLRGFGRLALSVGRNVIPFPALSPSEPIPWGDDR